MKKGWLITIIVSIIVLSGFSQVFREISFEDWKTIFEKGNTAEKRMALEAFGAMRISEAEEMLLLALNHEDREIRLASAWILGNIGSIQAVEPLIWMMNTHNDARIDGALVNIGGPAVHWLTVRLRLATMIEDISYGMRLSRILVDIQDPEGIAVVASFLGGLMGSEVYKSRAIELLNQIGEKAVEPLIQTLGVTTDPRVQSDVIRTLASIGDRRALEVIYPLIRSSHATVRISAANALGRIQSPHNTDYLISLLQDKDDDVRINAIVALGALKDSRSVVYLLTSLNDSNPIIKGFSAYALGELKDVRAVYPLISLLNDTTILKMHNPRTGKWEEATIRSFAAEALRKIQDPRGLEELEKRGL